MKYILIALSIVFPRVVNAQNEAGIKHNLDSIIYQYIVEHDLPSLAVGVVYEDSILYGKRIVNTKDIEVSLKADKNSIYNIASLAKPMVATAVMMLVQNGKIELQSPIVEYLPDFTIDSKYLSEITVEHLLTHTSGLPSVNSPDAYSYLVTDTTDQALEKHIKSLSSLKLKFNPGKKYSYSNVGFEILGEIVSKVSKSSFDEYMRINLFRPLEMNKTSYILNDFSKDEIAKPYIGHPYKMTSKFPYNRAFSPSGNLFTSIEDMNHWMIFNLKNGVFKSFKPLSDQHYSTLITPRFDTKEDGFIGMSWFTKDSSAGTIVFHDGMDLGYSSLMVLFKEPKIGILILSNHQETDCNEILNIIAKSIKF